MSKKDIENRKPIRELIQTDNAPNAVGTYSQAVSASGYGLTVSTNCIRCIIGLYKLSNWLSIFNIFL